VEEAVVEEGSRNIATAEFGAEHTPQHGSIPHGSPFTERHLADDRGVRGDENVLA
jgi:hypothetical protein